jgi:hypothetical protein
MPRCSKIFADLLQSVKDLPEEVQEILPEWLKDQLPDAEPDEGRGHPR